ncbi:hypothetical protein [Halosegnis longus]|uniref:Pentapeptide repeat-containing protein n=1 Tax=Halosegnis longus TaxID=2216012 RepID=A0AAJ4R8Q1_9EURY|nr:hypothetical protein Nmn1133_06640 [Salella cibi]
MACRFAVNIDGEYSGAEYLDLDHEDSGLITTDRRDGDRYHECPRETIGDDEFCLFHQLPHEDPREPDDVYPWLDAAPRRRDDKFTDGVVSRVFRRAVEGTLGPDDPPCDVVDGFSSEQRTHLRRVFIGSQFDYLDLKDRELDTPGRHSIDLRLSHIRICNLNYVRIRTTLQMDGAEIGIFTARNGHIDESLILDGITCGEMGLSGEGVRTSPRSNFGEREHTKCSIHGSEIGFIFSMKDAHVNSDVTFSYAHTHAHLDLANSDISGKLWGSGFHADNYVSLDGIDISGDCNIKNLASDRYLSIREARVDGDCESQRVDTGRYISLQASEIGGDCNLREASTGSYVRVNAVIGGGLTLSRATIEDDIKLGECHVGGVCTLQKTILTQDLNFEGLAGGFDIRAAQVGGNINFEEGSVAPQAAVSGLPEWMDMPTPADREYELRVRKTQVDGGIFAPEAVIRGSVSIDESDIDYQLSLTSALITNSLEVIHSTTQVVIGDAVQAGSITLDYTTVDLSVRIRRATVFGGISLDHLIVGDDVPAGGLDYGLTRTNERASLGGVNLTGSFVGGLSLERSELDGGVEMSYLTNTGNVNLVNATLGEALVAKYTTTFGDLNAEFATIGDQANITDSLVCGTVNLNHATVANSLVLGSASTFGSVLMRAAEIGTGAAQSSAAVQLSNAAIGGHLNARESTFGADFNLAGATVGGGVYLEQTTFESTLRLLEADSVRQGRISTTIEDSIRLNNAVIEGNFELSVTDQTRTQIRGIIDLDGVTVHSETEVELPAARYSPRVVSLRGAELQHGTFSYAESADTLPGRYIPESASQETTDDPDASETDAAGDTPQTDDDESLPMLPDLSISRDEYTDVPRTVLNLERATVGDLSLFPETPQPTDHVHILETTFNGFRFSAVREDFRNSDWSVHEVRGGQEGYRDLAVANALHEIIGEDDESPVDREHIADRALELFTAGLDDPDSLREMISLPADARNQNSAEIEVAVESMAALAAESDRPVVSPLIASIKQGEFSTTRQPLTACIPFTRLARQLNRLLARQIILDIPEDTAIDAPNDTRRGIGLIAQQFMIALRTSQTARELIYTGDQNNDRPTVGDVLLEAGIEPQQAVKPILQASVPDLSVALAYALDSDYEGLDLPRAGMDTVVYLAASPHRPGGALLLPKGEEMTYHNPDLAPGGIGYDAVTIEGLVNQARWRVSVLAAIEEADPGVVRPTPDRIEATYLALKNAASDVGDNRAAGEFFTQEKTWARARHRLLSSRRLRARVAQYRRRLRTVLPQAVQPTPTGQGGDSSDGSASHGDGTNADAGDEAADTEANGSGEPVEATTESTNPDIEAQDDSSTEAQTTAETSSADTAENAQEDAPPEEADPAETDATAVTSSRNRSLAADSEQKALNEPLVPVLYAYVANKFFDLIAEYGEKPQRVIGYSILVVIAFAGAFGGIWGPAGFDTGGTAPYEQPILGYVIVSLASFTAFVMGGSTIIAAPLLRFVALVEAFLGAFLVGLFIFALTRSVHR